MVGMAAWYRSEHSRIVTTASAVDEPGVFEQGGPLAAAARTMCAAWDTAVLLIRRMPSSLGKASATKMPVHGCVRFRTDCHSSAH
jgi:hypothetical protein